MPEKAAFTSRRRFLKGAGAVGLASPLVAKEAIAGKPGKKADVKNLIFLVVDGMCNGTMGLAHHWNRRNKNQLLNWMQLYDRSDLRRCLQETASGNSPVTDSAAAASAWGSGQRVNNGSVNTTPEGDALTPLMALAKNAGKRTGLVSTCRISHATPAGFAASVADRNNENEIIAQYLKRGVDLLMGGGARHFRQEVKGGEAIDYFQAFGEAGYSIVRNREQLKRLGRKEAGVLGIFSDSHIPYAIDRRNDRGLGHIPSLPEMFGAALNQLKNSREGFVLQVEGGRVDHAGHANDPAAILHELLDFDRCIPTALKFVERNPDTMLIVTTDHGTGGCQLDGLGGRYLESGPALDRINRFRHSFEWLGDRFRASGKFDPHLFRHATGIAPSREQVAAMQAAVDNPNVRYLSNAIIEQFSGELTHSTAVGWSSKNHTSENVELLAFGGGPERLPGFLRNDELFGIMTESLGI